MTSEQIRAWQAIFRDIVITLVAAFMLIFGATSIQNPTILGLVLGGGLTLLGVPPILRADRRRNGDD